MVDMSYVSIHKNMIFFDSYNNVNLSLCNINF